MQNEFPSRVRYSEALWRAHHTAWQQSALNQREYCEAHGIPEGQKFLAIHGKLKAERVSSTARAPKPMRARLGGDWGS